MSEDWTSIYKLARLAFLAITLTGLALYIYHPSRRSRLEAPARRMLEDDDT